MQVRLLVHIITPIAMLISFPQVPLTLHILLTSQVVKKRFIPARVFYVMYITN